jgi:hypothetical protein
MTGGCLCSRVISLSAGRWTILGYHAAVGAVLTEIDHHGTGQRQTSFVTTRSAGLISPAAHNRDIILRRFRTGARTE